jgi:general secretion pathway protein M
MTSSGLMAGLRARWQALRPRERNWILAAVTVVVLALFWWVSIAPALKIVRQADVQQRNLDAQWQQMQALAAEAQALQLRPKTRYDDAVRALEASVKQGLGPGAQLNVVAERATVTLKNVPAAVLGPWLAQVRANARALPGEARLVRGVTPAGASGVTWDGTLVMNLPPR